MPESYEFEWPKPEDNADETILRNVRTHGCHVVSIPDGNPHFTFSVGLFANYSHPELITFGLNGNSGHTIINEVRDRVAAGQRFSDGDVADDILIDGYKVCFWYVPLEAFREYLGTAIWLYSKSPIPFPCLQIIWQDRNRRFPWEDGCDPAVKADQPLLKMVS